LTVTADGFLETLSDEDCLRLLRMGSIGRVGVVVDGFPVIVPANYRVIEDAEGIGLTVRTGSGSAMDQALEAALEVDGIDPLHHQGWSVLVRGLLTHLSDLDVERLGRAGDPHPWVGERDSWLLLRPIGITGRRLFAPEIQWEFTLRGYL
jgi:uncharacterized protein